MTSDWAPSASDLRTEMLARQLDTTDAHLQPTLDRIAASLNAELGALLTPHWLPVAYAYVLYAGAAQVEARLFPEQQAGSSSQSAFWDLKAGAELARLRTGLGLTTGATGTGAGEPAAGYWSGSLSMGG